jgi:enamine deaminase RidA (YjgF/YER057c/UK114 family)
MARQVIEPQGGISQGTRVANHVFLSGQVAFDEGGELVGEGNAEAQAEQIFRNIERVLGKAGAGLDDVTLLTAYLTDAAHFPAYSAVKRRHFPSDPPAGTTVIVAGLLDARFLLEVEVHAVVAEPERG